MNLTSRKIIKDLLNRYQISPSKKLGQNFLAGREALKKAIWAADLKKGDNILEIGPGLGVLTQELAKRAKRVVAIEKDIRMINLLEETLKGFKNIETIQGDIRKIESQAFPFKKAEVYKVVGNLPFYLTGPVIRQFLEGTQQKPSQMVFLIQKEVGQRICSQPPRMSILAVSVQVYAKAEVISYIPRESFWPQPKVDSAIIKIVPLNDRGNIDFHRFFRIVKAGFSQPRKQLANNLAKKLCLKRADAEGWLLKNKINPKQRAETLSVVNWLNLTKTLK